MDTIRAPRPCTAAESGQGHARDVGVNVVVSRDDDSVCFFERVKAGCTGDGEP